MGILKHGIFGAVSGRLGNIVGYNVQGKNVVRVVGIISKPPTVKQLACRQEMRVVVKFLNPIGDFINAGFRAAASQAKKYPHNMAVSFNKRNALTGTYPDITMDYSKVQLSKGSLSPAEMVEIDLVEEGLKFAWNTSASSDWYERRQLAMLLVYFPKHQNAVYCIAGAKRHLGTDILKLSPHLKTAYMETYISFVDIYTLNTANSFYSGSVNEGLVLHH